MKIQNVDYENERVEEKTSVQRGTTKNKKRRKMNKEWETNKMKRTKMSLNKQKTSL